MIDRYTSQAMQYLWSDENKYDAWRAVEIVVARSSEKHGIIPTGVAQALGRSRRPETSMIQEFEKQTRHDVVAFLQAWQHANPGVDEFRYLHYGLTSSDVVDTALGLVLYQVSDEINAAVCRYINLLQLHALEHQRTYRIGRSHGVPAEVSSWGLKVADVYYAARRAWDHFTVSRRLASVAMVSGPVGTHSHLPPVVEAEVALALGLTLPETSTQVVARDRLATWAFSCVSLINSVEMLALEVRLGTHLGELSERRVEGQVGSSAMPHKVNPVRSEKICGLARLARGLVHPLMETALWHERDISHSSVERTALVDLSTITEHVLREGHALLNGLQVDAGRMAAGIMESGTTRHTATDLLRRIDEGHDRWNAHGALAHGENPKAIRPNHWYLRNTEAVFDGLRRLPPLSY